MPVPETYVSKVTKTDFINVAALLNDVEAVAALSGAKGTRTTAQSIPNSTNTAIQFDVEVYDNGGYHSTTVNNSRFVAVKDGLHQVAIFGNFANSGTGVRQLMGSVNGVVSYAGYAEQDGRSGGNGNLMAITVDYDLNIGDYVEAVVWQNSGGALNLFGTNAPTLHIRYVGVV